MLEFIGRCRYG